MILDWAETFVGINFRMFGDLYKKNLLVEKYGIENHGCIFIKKTFADENA